MNAGHPRTAAAILAALLITPLPAIGDDTSGTKSVHERFFQFLDRNGSGALESEELAAAPEPVRFWLQKHGLSQESSISRVEFLNFAPRFLDDLRSGTGIGVRRYPVNDSHNSADPRPLAVPGGNPSFRTENEAVDEDRSSRDAGVSPVSDATMLLPQKYRERDTDGDGQIDFFEWRNWNRGAIAEFARLDVNSDGILTRLELHFAETGKWSVEVASSSDGGSGGTSAAGSSSTGGASGSSSRDREETEEQIRGYFEYMDQNKNGAMDPDEWSISRRIKPMFEQAGIDISRPMSQREFIAHYKKAKAAAASRSDEDSSDEENRDRGSDDRNRPGGSDSDDENDGDRRENGDERNRRSDSRPGRRSR